MYKDLNYRSMNRENEYLVGAYCAIYNNLLDFNNQKADIFGNDNKYSENVWVFPTADILHRMNMECKLGDRSKIETNESLYQIIPYVTFTYSTYRGESTDGKYILKYTRGDKGGENRLKTKHSIGFGGHIEELPIDKGSHYLFNVICDAALREANEEIGIPLSDALREYVRDSLANGSNFIVEDSPVGQVHLGIHLNINLDSILRSLEDTLETDFINMDKFINSLLGTAGNEKVSVDVEEDVVKDISLCLISESILFDYNWEGWSREVIAKNFV